MFNYRVKEDGNYAGGQHRCFVVGGFEHPQWHADRGGTH